MPELSVPWGRDSLTLALPAHWELQQVAAPSLRPAESDWVDRLAVSLAQPGSGLPLGALLRARRTGRIVLILEDLTRHSPLPEIIEVVLREVHHVGIPDKQIELFFATGMHPPMTPEQVREKVGAVGESLSWRCNPWGNPKAYVRVGRIHGADVMIDRGVAEADLRILVSSVSPHLQAGFGGGYKMVVPGCASLETIRTLHRRGVGRGLRQLVGMEAAENPMRRFIDEAGRLVDGGHGGSFAVQYVLDNNDLPAYLGVGEVMGTQQMLTKQCAVACGVVVPTPADVLITNAHPRDLDLWQCFKCIPNTLWAARENGVIICLARCPAGAQGMKLPSISIRASWMRRIVRWLGAEGLSAFLTRTFPGLAGDAAFFVRLATQALYRNPILMVSPSLHAAGVRFPGLEVVASPDDAIAAADALLGGGPQNVVVFPAGGTTYPVVPPTPGRGKGSG